MTKKAATKKKSTASALSPREKIFVAEFVRCTNATMAAVRAGYSQKTARKQGSRLLTKVDIAEAIAKGMEKRSEKVMTDAEWLLRRLREEADADIADLYDDNNSLRPIKDWPKVWRTGLVTGLDVEQLFEGQGEERKMIGISTKIKHADRNAKLTLIGRHVNVQAFKDRVKLSADEPLKALLAQVVGQSIRPKDDGSGGRG